MEIDNTDICNSKCEKLLRVKFDHKITFDDHISKLCRKASRKIHALARVTSMNISKRHILLSAFFTLQFSYCPFI